MRVLAAVSAVVSTSDTQVMGAELAGVHVRVEASAKPPERATGDGCGCLLVASTSTGCLLGSNGIGERLRECCRLATPWAVRTAGELGVQARR